MSFFLASWLSCQFLAVQFPTFALQTTIFGLVIFSFIPIFFFLSTLEFVEVKQSVKKKTLIPLAISLLIMVLAAAAPGTIKSASINNGGVTIETGPGYTIQTILVVAVLFASIYIFVRNFHNFSQTKRLAAQYLTIGIIIAVLGNFIAGYVYPNNASAQFIGPLSVVAMAAIITYSITKHKLFDIRLVVARSIAYIFTLGFITLIFSLLVFGLSGAVIENHYSQIIQRLFYVAVTIVLVLTYPPLKRWFDRITNRLFYRDAYDPQVFMDNLNRSLVTTLELDNILTRSSDIIGSTLKAEFCGFSIADAEYQDLPRVIGLPQQQTEVMDTKGFKEELSHIYAKTIVIDELDADKHKLKEFLQKNNIALLVRLTKSVKTPSQDVGHIVMGIKKSGNPYSSQDVKILEIVADELVIAIQNALRFEEIQTFNKTLQAKVDEATRKLRQTNEKLKALDETKDEFISMASHQLRTPLTSVKGYISMVLEGDAGKLNDMQKKLLNQSFISSQRMVYLIADLLNVSRLKTGKFIIEAKPTRLADVIETELSQLLETAKAHGLELTYHKPANFPVLMLDETKIRQVIMNFADNAIYYTQGGKSKGHIQINLVDTGKSIEFTVVDDGIGVPKAAQHRLFTKFFRADNAQHARPDGTGLGLFMAKKVIVAQGGSLIFSSQEGKGSTFGFTFPKAKLLAPVQTTANIELSK